VKRRNNPAQALAYQMLPDYFASLATAGVCVSLNENGQE